MTIPDDPHSNPLMASLIAAFMIGGALLFLWVVRAGSRKTSRWNELLLKFPANDIHKFGGRYKRCDGFFGDRRDNNVNGAFLIEPAQEGLTITAFFAKNAPILIPWSAIREVEQINTGIAGTKVIVNVEFESRLGFFLPAAALSDLRQNVPAGRFSEPKSLFGVIKDRFRNLRKPANRN